MEGWLSEPRKTFYLGDRNEAVDPWPPKAGPDAFRMLRCLKKGEASHRLMR